jgi:O-antigen/teichoic acid export membrane protein
MAELVLEEESKESMVDTVMRRKPGAIRNVISNWGGYVFSMLIAFFLSPFVVHHLGDSGYGIWVLLISLTGYLGLLDLGVRSAVTRYLAKFHAEGNHEEAGRTASSALQVFTGAGVLAVLISIGVAWSALDYFHIPPAYQTTAKIVLPLAGLSVAISLIGGVFGGILAGLHRFDLVNAIQIGGNGLRALATIIALKTGGGLAALAVIQLIFALVGIAASYWLSFRLYPQLHLRWTRFDASSLRMIFSFSFYAFVLQITSYLILYSDSVVIAAFLPVAFVTFFSISGNLIQNARALISGISQTMTPLASKLDAEGNLKELQRVTLKGASYSTTLILPIALTFLIRGKTFIGLWMGHEYAEPSGQVLWALSLTLIPAGLQVVWAVLFGIGKHKALVPVSLIEGCLNLGLSIVLVRKIGIVGVAWGTAFPNLFNALIFWPWYVKRTLKIPIRQFGMVTGLKPAIAVLPFAVGSYVIEKWWPTSHLSVFFLQVGVILPLAFAGFWYMCVTPEERNNYQRQIRANVRMLLDETSTDGA